MRNVRWGVVSLLPLHLDTYFARTDGRTIDVAPLLAIQITVGPHEVAERAVVVM